MNLAATHYNCTSPMDYISHHTLHSHIPIHHHTNHTAVTNHSFALIASPHLHLIHPLTYKQHTYTHPLRSLVFPWLTFPRVFHSLSFRLPPGLLTLSPDRLLPALLTPPAYWLSSLLPTLTYCSASVYVSALSTLPSIPLFDICLSDPLFLLKKLHVDPFASVQSLHSESVMDRLLTAGLCGNTIGQDIQTLTYHSSTSNMAFHLKDVCSSNFTWPLNMMLT